MSSGKTVLLMMWAFAVISCNRVSKYNTDADYSMIDTIMYDLDNGTTVPRDEVFGNVRFLKLETTKDVLLGRIDQVLFGDSTIIVVDKRNAKAIYLFDYEGNAVGRVSRMGNGPQEYVNIKHVSKMSDGRIAVFDDFRSRIMTFDERGKYDGMINTDVFATSFEFIDTTNIIFDISSHYYPGYKPYDCYSFALKDRDMQIKYLFGRAYFGDDFNMVRIRNLYKFGDSIYCNVNFQDIIYVMDDNGVRAKYDMILKPHSASDFSFKSQDEFESIRNDYSSFEGDFFEMEDYTFIHYRGNSNEQILDLIYDHDTKSTVSVGRFFNNPMLTFWGYPIARYSDNTLVCSVNASQVMLFKDYLLENSGDSAELKQLYDDLSVDSNPVLFFFDLIRNQPTE